jgi:hypothetical protein
MKLMKPVLIFFVVCLTFGSCEQARLRKVHDREIRAELAKYSDILDTAKSEIHLEGGRYYFFNSAQSEILLSLYLNPGNDDRETIVAVRDDLVIFFENNSWETRERYGFQATNGLSDGGTIRRTAVFRINICREEFTVCMILLAALEPPFIRKKIHNEELDILLNKYSDILDIEQSGGFHSSTDFIRKGYSLDPICVILIKRGIGVGENQTLFRQLLP